MSEFPDMASLFNMAITPATPSYEGPVYTWTFKVIKPVVFVRKMPVLSAALYQPEVLGLKGAQLRVMMESDIHMQAEGRTYTIETITLVVDTAEAQMQITVTFAE